MKKLKVLAIALIGGIIATSCTMTKPVNATSNPVGSKVGESGGNVWFGIFYTNVDASIHSAAKNGKISKISTVDFRFKNNIIFQRYTCIVTGE